MTFISIQLNSNRPEQIRRFFDSVSQTADMPEDIEILLHIDAHDEVMSQAVEAEKTNHRFTLRIVQTDLVKRYADLWKPLNELLKLTAPDAYYIINLSDETLFASKGWDSEVRKYVGVFPDHMFRLRASQYRFRNYTDVWECGFAPDGLTFYTRRWLELQGSWNPCMGPDSFQQCVAFYLLTLEPFEQRQVNREIPLPYVSFSGEGASRGITGTDYWNRTVENNRMWFILMSHRMQQEAARRAMLIKATILAEEQPGAVVVHDAHQKRYLISGGGELESLSYRLSWLRITATNMLRIPFVLYFGGGRGRHGRAYLCLVGLVLMCCTYLPRGGTIMHRLLHFYRGIKKV